MARPTGSKTQYFRKVKQAREALKEKALDILNEYLQVVADARAEGNHQLAADSLQWLMEHMPDDDGDTLLNPSVSRKQLPAAEATGTGPKIQIGIALGGVTPPKALPQVTVVESPNDEDT